jgi:uncharacterized protein YcfJ
MKALVSAAVVASMVAFGAQAEAGSLKRGHGPARYDGGAYDYAKVIDADPIVHRVRVETPRRECWDEVREVRTRYDGPHSKGGMVLGGIIGGVVGHQIGSGRGKDVATVAGTIIGAAVGHDIAAERSGRNSGVREETVERCAVRYEEQYEERIDGYRVTYLYHGREYTTRLPYDPGDRIRVRVDVEPAE